MSVLVPMAEAAFPRFKTGLVARYASDNVRSGRWPQESAPERALKEFDHLLPQGLSTPDNFLFEIVDPATQSAVGSLWLGFSPRQGAREAFVFDVQVDEAFRRQGHARRAFEALEPLVRELGSPGIGLHVFGYNTAAQALYRSLGYGVTSMTMRKVFGEP